MCQAEGLDGECRLVGMYVEGREDYCCSSHSIDLVLLLGAVFVDLRLSGGGLRTVQKRWKG